MFEPIGRIHAFIEPIVDCAYNPSHEDESTRQIAGLHSGDKANKGLAAFFKKHPPHGSA